MYTITDRKMVNGEKVETVRPLSAEEYKVLLPFCLYKKQEKHFGPTLLSLWYPHVHVFPCMGEVFRSIHVQ